MSDRATTQVTAGFAPAQTSASQVSGVLQRKCASCGNHTMAGGKCEECEKQGGLLQRKSNGHSEPSVVPPIIYEVLNSPGQPLDAGTQAFFEPRFGQDFSNVRLHTDERAAKSAQVVSALAYTVGRNMVFGMGQYKPGTSAGRQLMAHELTHVVQQRHQTSASIGRLRMSQPSDANESEANRIAENVVSDRLVSPIASLPSTGQIQRQYTACFETSAEEFRRAPVCTPPSRVVGPGQNPGEVCGVFPGGSTDCEIANPETGELTGGVTMEVRETNPCVRPCVELHERVHVRQMRTICPALRDCYAAADAGRRPATDCFIMAMRGAQLECEAYSASVLCLEERLASAPECVGIIDFEYSQDVLEGEKCYLLNYCGQAETSRRRGGSAPGRQGTGVLQRVATTAEAINGAPPIVHEALDSPGCPLDAATRAFMEPRFGHDLSNVRVHTDAKAAESTRAVNALAYTVGRDIVFGAGQYNPAVSAGRWILAHELTHVIQQGARVVDTGAPIASAASRTHEQMADTIASAVTSNISPGKVRMSVAQADPMIMRLTPNQFRARLGSTPQQAAAIDTLFANSTFRALWDYLEACTATPQRDLGPLRLEVQPGLSIGGVERFGGYDPVSRTLLINPTKAEHVSNPSELVDTIVHELIHAVDDLQADCMASGAPPAPLGGGATVTPPTRADVAGTPDEAKLMEELGPGASNPCEEFIDINAAAQQMVVQIITENIQVARVGRPTLTFVNEILRRNPAAMTEYESCRGTACAISTPADRRRAIARCSAEIIGKFIPVDLVQALLPNQIYFDFDASVLRPESLETLEIVSLFLIAHPDVAVDLVGHADPVGSEDYNLQLGQRRADAVKQELLDRGVSLGQILSATSQGEQNPRSTNAATRWKDRRVDIIPSSVASGP